MVVSHVKMIGPLLWCKVPVRSLTSGGMDHVWVCSLLNLMPFNGSCMYIGDAEAALCMTGDAEAALCMTGDAEAALCMTGDAEAALCMTGDAEAALCMTGDAEAALCMTGDAEAALCMTGDAEAALCMTGDEKSDEATYHSELCWSKTILLILLGSKQCIVLLKFSNVFSWCTQFHSSYTLSKIQ